MARWPMMRHKAVPKRYAALQCLRADTRLAVELAGQEEVLSERTVELNTTVRATLEVKLSVERASDLLT
eukprot:6300022-Prymnesium_polylepis.2